MSEKSITFAPANVKDGNDHKELRRIDYGG